MLDYQKVRQMGEGGTLTRAGARWKEPCPQYRTPLVVIGCFGLLGFLAYAVTVGGSMMVQSLALTAGSWSVAWFARQRQRELVFEADGRMSTPNGFPYGPMRMFIEGHHRNIMSIEAARVGDHGHVVRLISSGGDTVYLSEHLYADDALKVAVGLTNALTALRVDLALASAKGAGPGAAALADGEPDIAVTIS